MDNLICCVDCGDSAVVVRSVAADAEQRWATVHALADALDHAVLPGVHGVVPTYDALLVEFDCTRTDHQTIRDAINAALARVRQGEVRQPAARRFVVPVVYGGEHGPDLPRVARELGLTEQEVVDRHTSTPLTVRCLGAPVGAPMLDGPPFPRPVPRLASPRTSVPAGSVAVAGRQAVICSLRSPGGWPLLGRTPLRILDLHGPRLTPYRPGDHIQFVPIAPDEWADHHGRALAVRGD